MCYGVVLIPLCVCLPPGHRAPGNQRSFPFLKGNTSVAASGRFWSVMCSTNAKTFAVLLPCPIIWWMGELIFGAVNVPWSSEPHCWAGVFPLRGAGSQAWGRTVTAALGTAVSSHFQRSRAAIPEAAPDGRRSKEAPACLHMVGDKVPQLLICVYIIYVF